VKVLVAYHSQTGNTKKVAEAIFDEIQCDKEIKKIEDVASIEGYALAFIGFPVWQSGPSEPAKKFLGAQGAGTNIAIFVIHAMSSTPADRQLGDKLKGILENCRACASHTNLAGFFDCQGELSEAVADLLVKSNNPDLQRFAGLRGMTLGHPNEEELHKARTFARDIMNNFKS
jgi:flavodoxin